MGNLGRFLKGHDEQAYALLRGVFGLMFSFHGMQKVLGVLTQQTPPVGSQIWVGGVIELVAGIAIAIGLFTRCAAVLASGTMAVAYVQFHWRFHFDEGFFPAINKGEPALLYALVFLFIAFHGAGIWSVDARRGRA